MRQLLVQSPIELRTKRGLDVTWLQVLSHVDPRFGGIASSVPQMCRATEAAGGHSCPIAGFCRPEELEGFRPDNQSLALRVPPRRLHWLVDSKHRSQLRELVRGSQGVHIHGIWEPHCAVMAGMARSCKKPYMISAHGMLDEWALRHKRLKKALYAALVETNNLQRAACLRALTRDEVGDYRRIGLTAPAVVVPTGVEAPQGATGDLFWQSHPELKSKRIVLFLGRLHPKKGLHLLLPAWRRAMQTDEEAHLVIAGPDPENLRPLLQQEVAEFKLEHGVTFAGMLHGEAKWSALAAAKAFVLPSYSEGFSVAVLEALAMGVPAIISTPCHFPEVAEQDCGWVIRPEADALEESLRQYRQTSPAALSGMGERGRTLVEKRFSWPVVGRQMAEVHEWLLGGARPATVELA